MSNENVLKSLNDFINNNKVFVPADDEGNYYQEANKLELNVRYVTNEDYDRSSIEDTYSREDIDDNELDDFKEVYVLYY